MQHRLLHLIAFVVPLLFSGAYAQWTVDSTPAEGDCINAKPLNLALDYHFPAPPVGGGQISEISDPHKRSPMDFEEEHHTAWYALNIPADGNLSFDIIPDQLKDDYDFILYKYEDSLSCEMIATQKLRPVRANIGRNDTTISSMTGIRHKEYRNFKRRGPGPSYSKALKVGKGEKYFLVVDNVYDGGKGHKIRFGLTLDTLLTGNLISDLSKKPVQGQVYLEDQTSGDTIAFTTSDSRTGAFEIALSLEYGHDYRLITQAKGHFFKELTMNPEKIHRYPLSDYQFPMPELRPGRKFSMHTIHFVGNEAIVLEESYPSLNRLLKLMEMNPPLEIEIEGHTNGVGTITSPMYHQELSESRAKRIKEFLTEFDIPDERIKTQGFGCSKMLYPRARNEEQLKKNRRVEIRVVSYVPGT